MSLSTPMSLARSVDPPRPVTARLRADRLTIDHEVQRPLDTAWVNRIVADYQPDALGVLVVNRRLDGTIHVIDGQHRLAATRAVGREHAELECLVYSGLSKQDEAAMFRRLNNMKNVQPLDRFRVRTVEQEPVAVAINALLRKYGWELRTGKGPFSFASVSTIEKVYRSSEDPDRVVDLTLYILTTAWGGRAESMRSELVAGVGAILSRYGDAVDIPKLVEQLAQHSGGPLGIVGKARALREARGGTMVDAAAEILVNMINVKRRVNRLPEWRAA